MTVGREGNPRAPPRGLPMRERRGQPQLAGFDAPGGRQSVTRLGAFSSRIVMRSTFAIADGAEMRTSITAPGRSFRPLNRFVSDALPLAFTDDVFFLNGQPFFLPPLQDTRTLAPAGASLTFSDVSFV